MRWDLHKILKNKYKRFLGILMIVFCFGMVFMVMNNEWKSKKSTLPNEFGDETLLSQQQNTSTFAEQFEKKLATQLQKIEGVGNVEVIITMKSNGELILNKDQPIKSSTSNEVDGQGSTAESTEIEQEMATILVQNSDGSEEPIVIKELTPEVSGILIIAEGGENIVVKSNLIQAAKVLLDLPANKIEVLKMVSKK